MALTALMEAGIKKQDIAVIPFEEPPSCQPSWNNNTEHAFELAFILATIASVIAASIGYRLYLGPIIWGTGAAVFGFFCGLLIQWLQSRSKVTKKEMPILIVITSTRSQEHVIKDILWTFRVIGQIFISHS